jgi:hypothetical protein
MAGDSPLPPSESETSTHAAQLPLLLLLRISYLFRF